MKYQMTCPVCYGEGKLDIKKGEINDYFEHTRFCPTCNGVGILVKEIKRPKNRGW